MTRRVRTPLVAACIASAAMMPAPAVSASDYLKFTIRAAPERAAAIDALLAQYAEPVNVTVPKQTDITQFLRNRCASGARLTADRTPDKEPTSTTQVLTFTPCIQSRSNARIRVQPGDTLEKIALRWGLHAGQATQLQFAHLERSDRKTPIAPQDLRPGDVVLAPEVPLWTDFAVNAEKLDDASELIGKIAVALRCGSEEPISCLSRLGVFVLRLDPTDDYDGELLRAMSMLFGWSPNVAAFYKGKSERDAADRLRDRCTPPKRCSKLDEPDKSWQLEESFEGPMLNHGAMLNNVFGSLVGLAPDTEDDSPIKVPDEQWPYDRELIRLIIADALDHGAEHTVIGIAESGLANRDGQPLPGQVFTNVRRDMPPTNGEDDDLNEYIDDLIGAGSLRGNELAASGDVALCYPSDVTPFPYLSLPDILKRRADHGPMVASIAAGLPFRTDDALDRALPKLVFFRLSDGDCVPTSTLDIRPDAVIEAVRYLQTRADILDLNYSFDGPNATTVAHALMPTLTRNTLLIVSAGNRPEDLDIEIRCPQCLARPEFVGSSAAVAARILVIGAATQSLLRESYSGWGERTVRLYAPGKPTGAVDMVGNDASAVDSATSFAAPYAAFGAAMMRSLGVKDLTAVAQRLQLATWPRFDEHGRRQEAGVLDLVKAVAVRHWSVEIRERTAEGQTLLRTYVGDLPDDGAKLLICDGQKFSSARFQSVRFEEPNESGKRNVVATTRNLNGMSQFNKVKMEGCMPSGAVRIKALRDGDMEFQLSDVSSLIAPW